MRLQKAKRIVHAVKACSLPHVLKRLPYLTNFYSKKTNNNQIYTSHQRNITYNNTFNPNQFFPSVTENNSKPDETKSSVFIKPPELVGEISPELESFISTMEGYIDRLNFSMNSNTDPIRLVEYVDSYLHSCLEHDTTGELLHKLWPIIEYCDSELSADDVNKILLKRLSWKIEYHDLISLISLLMERKCVTDLDTASLLIYYSKSNNMFDANLLDYVFEFLNHSNCPVSVDILMELFETEASSKVDLYIPLLRAVKNYHYVLNKDQWNQISYHCGRKHRDDIFKQVLDTNRSNIEPYMYESFFKGCIIGKRAMIAEKLYFADIETIFQTVSTYRCPLTSTLLANYINCISFIYGIDAALEIYYRYKELIDPSTGSRYGLPDACYGNFVTNLIVENKVDIAVKIITDECQNHTPSPDALETTIRAFLSMRHNSTALEIYNLYVSKGYIPSFNLLNRIMEKIGTVEFTHNVLYFINAKLDTITVDPLAVGASGIVPQEDIDYYRVASMYWHDTVSSCLSNNLTEGMEVSDRHANLLFPRIDYDSPFIHKGKTAKCVAASSNFNSKPNEYIPGIKILSESNHIIQHMHTNLMPNQLPLTSSSINDLHLIMNKLMSVRDISSLDAILYTIKRIGYSVNKNNIQLLCESLISYDKSLLIPIFMYLRDVTININEVTRTAYLKSYRTQLETASNDETTLANPDTETPKDHNDPSENEYYLMENEVGETESMFTSVSIPEATAMSQDDIQNALTIYNEQLMLSYPNDTTMDVWSRLVAYIMRLDNTEIINQMINTIQSVHVDDRYHTLLSRIYLKDAINKKDADACFDIINNMIVYYNNLPADASDHAAVELKSMYYNNIISLFIFLLTSDIVKSDSVYSIYSNLNTDGTEGTVSYDAPQRDPISTMSNIIHNINANNKNALSSITNLQQKRNLPLLMKVMFKLAQSYPLPTVNKDSVAVIDHNSTVNLPTVGDECISLPTIASLVESSVCVNPFVFDGENNLYGQLQSESTSSLNDQKTVITSFLASEMNQLPISIVIMLTFLQTQAVNNEPWSMLYTIKTLLLSHNVIIHPELYTNMLHSTLMNANPSDFTNNVYNPNADSLLHFTEEAIELFHILNIVLHLPSARVPSLDQMKLYSLPKFNHLSDAQQLALEVSSISELTKINNEDFSLYPKKTEKPVDTPSQLSSMNAMAAAMGLSLDNCHVDVHKETEEENNKKFTEQLTQNKGNINLDKNLAQTYLATYFPQLPLFANYYYSTGHVPSLRPIKDVQASRFPDLTSNQALFQWKIETNKIMSIVSNDALNSLLIACSNDVASFAVLLNTLVVKYNYELSEAFVAKALNITSSKIRLNNPKDIPSLKTILQILLPIAMKKKYMFSQDTTLNIIKHCYGIGNLSLLVQFIKYLLQMEVKLSISLTRTILQTTMSYNFNSRVFAVNDQTSEGLPPIHLRTSYDIPPSVTIAQDIYRLAVKQKYTIDAESFERIICSLSSHESTRVFMWELFHEFTTIFKKKMNDEYERQLKEYNQSIDDYYDTLRKYLTAQINLYESKRFNVNKMSSKLTSARYESRYSNSAGELIDLNDRKNLNPEMINDYQTKQSFISMRRTIGEPPLPTTFRVSHTMMKAVLGDCIYLHEGFKTVPEIIQFCEKHSFHFDEYYFEVMYGALHRVESRKIVQYFNEITNVMIEKVECKKVDVYGRTRSKPNKRPKIMESDENDIEVDETQPSTNTDNDSDSSMLIYRNVDLRERISTVFMRLIKAPCPLHNLVDVFVLLSSNGIYVNIDAFVSLLALAITQKDAVVIAFLINIYHNLSVSHAHVMKNTPLPSPPLTQTKNSFTIASPDQGYWADSKTITNSGSNSKLMNSGFKSTNLDDFGSGKIVSPHHAVPMTSYSTEVFNIKNNIIDLGNRLNINSSIFNESNNSTIVSNDGHLKFSVGVAHNSGIQSRHNWVRESRTHVDYQTKFSNDDTLKNNLMLASQDHDVKVSGDNSTSLYLFPVLYTNPQYKNQAVHATRELVRKDSLLRLTHVLNNAYNNQQISFENNNNSTSTDEFGYKEKNADFVEQTNIPLNDVTDVIGWTINPDKYVENLPASYDRRIQFENKFVKHQLKKSSPKPQSSPFHVSKEVNLDDTYNLNQQLLAQLNMFTSNSSSEPEVKKDTERVYDNTRDQILPLPNNVTSFSPILTHNVFCKYPAFFECMHLFSNHVSPTKKTNSNIIQGLTHIPISLLATCLDVLSSHGGFPLQVQMVFTLMMKHNSNVSPTLFAKAFLAMRTNTSQMTVANSKLNMKFANYIDDMLCIPKPFKTSCLQIEYLTPLAQLSNSTPVHPTVERYNMNSIIDSMTTFLPAPLRSTIIGKQIPLLSKLQTPSYSDNVTFNPSIISAATPSNATNALRRIWLDILELSNITESSTNTSVDHDVSQIIDIPQIVDNTISIDLVTSMLTTLQSFGTIYTAGPAVIQEYLSLTKQPLSISLFKRCIEVLEGDIDAINMANALTYSLALIKACDASTDIVLRKYYTQCLNNNNLEEYYSKLPSLLTPTVTTSSSPFNNKQQRSINDSNTNGSNISSYNSEDSKFQTLLHNHMNVRTHLEHHVNQLLLKTISVNPTGNYNVLDSISLIDSSPKKWKMNKTNLLTRDRLNALVRAIFACRSHAHSYDVQTNVTTNTTPLTSPINVNSGIFVSPAVFNTAINAIIQTKQFLDLTDETVAGIVVSYDMAIKWLQQEVLQQEHIYKSSPFTYTSYHYYQSLNDNFDVETPNTTTLSDSTIANCNLQYLPPAPISFVPSLISNDSYISQTQNNDSTEQEERDVTLAIDNLGSSLTTPVVDVDDCNNNIITIVNVPSDTPSKSSVVTSNKTQPAPIPVVSGVRALQTHELLMSLVYHFLETGYRHTPTLSELPAKKQAELKITDPGFSNPLKAEFLQAIVDTLIDQIPAASPTLGKRSALLKHLPIPKSAFNDSDTTMPSEAQITLWTDAVSSFIDDVNETMSSLSPEHLPNSSPASLAFKNFDDMLTRLLKITPTVVQDDTMNLMLENLYYVLSCTYNLQQNATKKLRYTSINENLRHKRYPYIPKPLSTLLDRLKEPVLIPSNVLYTFTNFIVSVHYIHLTNVNYVKNSANSETYRLDDIVALNQDHVNTTAQQLHDGTYGKLKLHTQRSTLQTPSSNIISKLNNLVSRSLGTDRSLSSSQFYPVAYLYYLATNNITGFRYIISNPHHDFHALSTTICTDINTTYYDALCLGYPTWLEKVIKAVHNRYDNPDILSRAYNKTISLTSTSQAIIPSRINVHAKNLNDMILNALFTFAPSLYHPSKLQNNWSSIIINNLYHNGITNTKAIKDSLLMNIGNSHLSTQACTLILNMVCRGCPTRSLPLVPHIFTAAAIQMGDNTLLPWDELVRCVEKHLLISHSVLKLDHKTHNLSMVSYNKNLYDNLTNQGMYDDFTMDAINRSLSRVDIDSDSSSILHNQYKVTESLENMLYTLNKLGLKTNKSVLAIWSNLATYCNPPQLIKLHVSDGNESHYKLPDHQMKQQSRYLLSPLISHYNAFNGYDILTTNIVNNPSGNTIEQNIIPSEAIDAIFSHSTSQLLNILTELAPKAFTLTLQTNRSSNHLNDIILSNQYNKNVSTITLTPEKLHDIEQLVPYLEQLQHFIDYHKYTPQAHRLVSRVYNNYINHQLIVDDSHYIKYNSVEKSINKFSSNMSAYVLLVRIMMICLPNDQTVNRVANTLLATYELPSTVVDTYHSAKWPDSSEYDQTPLVNAMVNFCPAHNDMMADIQHRLISLNKKTY